MMDQLAVMECKTCQFWKSDDDEGFGECRRYAPKPQTFTVGDDFVEPRIETIWPLSWYSDICGDWKIKHG
jgi:hypothetical protein